MTAGDKVILCFAERRVEALVGLVSPNGKSATFTFEAIVAGHIGMMPAIMHDATHGETLIGGEPFEVEPC